MSVTLWNAAMQFREELGELRMAEWKLMTPARRKGSPPVDRTAAFADRTSVRMTRLSQNLETCAALMRGEAFERENCDIVRLVSEICEQSADLAEYLELDLRFFCGEAKHICAIRAEYIQQMCYHLMSNAMKSASSGGYVRVSLLFPRDTGTLTLSVEDNGCGIAPEKLPALFDFRTDIGLKAFPEGLGLGLPICRKIAEWHGGSITAESEVGKGSKFTVTLPDETQKTARFRQPNFFEPEGGIHPSLLGLSDALPWEAFRIEILM